MIQKPDWLPDITTVSGIWEEVLGKLYSIFEKDIKIGKPKFNGVEVWYNRKILPGDKYEEGFWHLISRKDKDTNERLPDFRRAERLPWCAPLIVNSNEPIIKTWDYEEGDGNINTYIWLENFDYIIILRKKSLRIGIVAHLITAYHIDGDSQKRRFRIKYEKRL